jgi:hypothetical protein
MMALTEPKKGGGWVGLDIQRIHVTDESDLRACDGRVVDIEGYLTHAPIRGGEQWFVMAEAMSSPTDAQR